MPMWMQFQSTCIDLNQRACASSASVWSRPPLRRAARHQKRQEATMAEPDGSGISARLWRLPGQLLLVLINATAILVIVAGIVALVAIARINHFAENIVATMTGAVLAKVDLPQKDVLANIRNLTGSLGRLATPFGRSRQANTPPFNPR